MKKTIEVKLTKAQKKAARKAEKLMKKATKKGTKAAKVLLTLIKALKKLDEIGLKAMGEKLASNKKFTVEAKQLLQKLTTSLAKIKAKVKKAKK